MRVVVEISPGELFDKLSILDIKLREVSDPDRLIHVKNEIATLSDTADKVRATLDDRQCQRLDEICGLLKEVNQKLWVSEDKLRQLEAQSEFGEEFVELARSIYIDNDHRASFKAHLNQLFDCIFLKSSLTPLEMQ